MKYVRTGILVAALCVALVFLFRQGPESDLLHLWELDFTQLEKLAVNMDQVDYSLQRGPEHWQLQQGETHQNIEAARVLPWLQQLLHPHAKSVLGGAKTAVKDYTTYGLQPAQGMILLKSSGQEHRLLIGYKTPIQDNYYVQVAGEPAVYLFSVYELNDFLLGRFQALIPTELKEYIYFLVRASSALMIVLNTLGSIQPRKKRPLI